jgi:hypothetical protein
MVNQINKTIKHYFPDLQQRLNSVKDSRSRIEYSIGELVMGGIAMFLFKEGSRNAFNLDRKEAKFRQKYQRLFKMRPPHLDAVEDLFRVLDEDELERLKAEFVSGLIRMKVFHKFKFLGKTFRVAVDATNTVTYDYQHCPHCITKKHGNKTTYFHYVLEAKLVTSNGLAISLCTEWIENPETDFDKQDCEQKAFKRIAIKLKKYFPRLPICIIADGLYPNEPFFNICEENNWDFIVNFRDGNLPTVWEEVNLLPESKKVKTETYHKEQNDKIFRKYKWINNIEYRKIKINRIEIEETVKNIVTKNETIKRFVYVTNLEINIKNAHKIMKTGRMRWKIENEGFKEQKTTDYEMEHKYSRASYLAMKNFYQCLQIAHLINQLCEKSQEISQLIKEEVLTTKYLWKRLIAFMLEGEFTENDICNLDIGRIQIRLAK